MNGDKEYNPCCSDLTSLEGDEAKLLETVAHSATASSRMSGFVVECMFEDSDKFVDEVNRRINAYKVGSRSNRVMVCATAKALGLCSARDEVDVEVRVNS